MGSGGDYSGGGGDMGGDMGGGGESMGGDMGGGGEEGGGITDMMGGGDEGSSMPTTDYGGGGGDGSKVGMLSFAVSDNMAGLGADTSSTKVSTTPAEAGTALNKSTQPINAKTPNANTTGSTISPPTGETANTAGAKPKENAGMTAAKEFGKAVAQDDNTTSNNQRPYQMPVTTYGALFGSPNLISKQPAAPAQIQPIQATPMATPPATIAPAQVPTAMPPVPLNMQLPQAPAVPQVPMTVSDVRAKQRIQDAHNSMDALLQRVYTNVVSKRKR